MTLAFFMDEDSLHKHVLVALRRAGFDCLTVTEAAREELSDLEELDFSTQCGRTILTRNTGDFSALDREWARTGRVHGGIIAVTGNLVNPGTILRAMQRIDASFDNDTIRGQFIHVRNYF